MCKYPEIQSLEELSNKFDIGVNADDSRILDGKGWYLHVNFKVNRKSFELYVDDEYGDFRLSNPILHLCLVLRELEGYTLAEDYLVWCRERFLDPANEEVRENYRGLGEVYSAVEGILGEVNSHISDHDFELNAGAAQFLRIGAG